jgi:hypothetical protein
MKNGEMKQDGQEKTTSGSSQKNLVMMFHVKKN